MNHVQNQSAPIRVEHRGFPPNRLVTALTYKRVSDAITAEVRQLYTELLQKHVLEPARSLPELAEFYALRGRGKHIEKDLAGLQIEVRQNEIDRDKLVRSDLGGEKLATKLAKLETAKKDLAARIETCNAGKTSFAKDLAEAEKVVRLALQAHLAKTRQAVLADAKQRLDTATAAIEGSTEFFKLLDDVATADRLGLQLRVGGGNDAFLYALIAEDPTSAEGAASATRLQHAAAETTADVA